MLNVLALLVFAVIIVYGTASLFISNPLIRFREMNKDRDYQPSNITDTTGVVVPFERPYQVQRTDTGWRGSREKRA